MFRNTFQSGLNIGLMLWEPLGVLLLIALGWSAWNLLKNRRSAWGWLCAAALVVPFLVHLRLGITSGRYQNYYVLPSLLLVFGLVWNGPWPRRWLRGCLLGVLLLTCFARVLWYEPMDGKLLALYEKIHEDARGYRAPVGISFTSSTGRDEYYSQIPCFGVDRKAPLEKQWDGALSNLSVFDGEYDAVYLFFHVRRDKDLHAEHWMPVASAGRLSLLGEQWLDRHKKKKLVVFRYRPGEKKHDEVLGTLLPNGDFSQPLAAVPNETLRKRLSRCSQRFLDESPIFPAEWNLYQSLALKGTSYATLVSDDSGTMLRMEADSYVVAITPKFPLTKDRILNFRIKAETDCYLQFSLATWLDSNREELYPLLPVRLKAKSDRRYSLRIPATADSRLGTIWFWLHHGTMELGDVRIQ